MTRWTSDSKQRASKKYKALHEALRAELAADKLPEPDKRARKASKSRDFRAYGE